ncbi:hypothetical protein SEA_TRACKER_1 [Gordonia phage Tracker]|nr:hypothetical protein SEA_TRACKER_1 [Gordonia phage Tracker]
MAGTGPAPKPASARQRKNKTSSNAVLRPVENPDIPPLPPAGDWLASQDEIAAGSPIADREWPKPVQRWWEDIWSSPMSSEFVDSDIHGLYLACFYMSQVLNPWLKMSDRISASKAYETQVRNFGLNPMSRRTLQWEIERSEEAQYRGRKRRERKIPDSAPEPADPRGVTEDATNPFTVVS